MFSWRGWHLLRTCVGTFLESNHMQNVRALGRRYWPGGMRVSDSIKEFKVSYAIFASIGCGHTRLGVLGRQLIPTVSLFENGYIQLVCSTFFSEVQANNLLLYLHLSKFEFRNLGLGFWDFDLRLGFFWQDASRMILCWPKRTCTYCSAQNA